MFSTEEEEKAKDEQRRKKLPELTERINLDLVRTERKELIRRGVYRGRRKAQARFPGIMTRMSSRYLIWDLSRFTYFSRNPVRL